MPLIRVRRRQDQAVRDLYARYPQLVENAGKTRIRTGDLLKQVLTAPVDFLVYFLVYVLTRVRRSSEDWARGR